MAYDMAGRGPGVVLLHGITSRREAWQPVSDPLTEPAIVGHSFGGTIAAVCAALHGV